MAHVDINIDDIKDPNQPAQEGTVTVECEECELTETKGGGLPMIRMQHVITDAEDEEDLGKRLFDYMVLDGDGGRFGRWRWKEYNIAAGLDGDETDEMVGQTFDVQIDVEAGQGEYGPSNRIRKVFHDE